MSVRRSVRLLFKLLNYSSKFDMTPPPKSHKGRYVQRIMVKITLNRDFLESCDVTLWRTGLQPKSAIA
jgi:hypothetical protein